MLNETKAALIGSTYLRSELAEIANYMGSGDDGDLGDVGEVLRDGYTSLR